MSRRFDMSVQLREELAELLLQVQQTVLDERRLQLGRQLLEERHVVEGVVAGVTHTRLYRADNIVPGLVVKLVKLRNGATRQRVFPCLLPRVPYHDVDPVHEILDLVHGCVDYTLQSPVQVQREQLVLDQREREDGDKLQEEDHQHVVGALVVGVLGRPQISVPNRRHRRRHEVHLIDVEVRGASRRRHAVC